MTGRTRENALELPDSLPIGDAEEFQRVFVAYLSPLCRFVYSYVDSWEVAQDVVNDVFFQLWVLRQDGKPVRDLKAYLFAAARNRALMYLRHQRVKSRHEAQHLEEAGDPVLAASAAGADEQVLADDLTAALQRAVDMLAPRQREVVLLKWGGEATNEEIGRALGVAPTTVGEHLRRALERLRAILSNTM